MAASDEAVDRLGSEGANLGHRHREERSGDPEDRGAPFVPMDGFASLRFALTALSRSQPIRIDSSTSSAKGTDM
jgi:hypothetical protein